MDGRAFKDAIFEQFARIGTAFDSPKRLEIIDVLAQGERSVESIAEATAMSTANASRHLQVLRHSGLVASHRDGLFTLYRLADESVIDGYRALRALAESRISEVVRLSDAFFGHVDGAEPVTLDELLSRSNAGDVVVVDVRPRLEFDAGHLPGAISIPLDELPQQLTGFDLHTDIVAYCRGPYCVFAAQAVTQLRAAGLSARRLEGGPLEWKASGFALESSQ
jgi:rhodanese-related sulfurtransferase